MKPQSRPAATTPVVSPQTMDRQTFLANVRQSGLLPADQFAKACRQLPDSNKALAIAKAMVDAGHLTRFQVEILLHGKTSGFFLGQYKILDHIGRGGMGRVYKAEHQTMNRVVAVKVLASRLVKTPKAQQMFQREVRAAARLVHPNIVTAYDASNAGDRCYLVMEYVEGANLEEIVKQHGPLPIGTACDFIRQAATGLQYAHEMGMVHRDIKPANLLVQRPNARTPQAICNVKILDFGLARLQAWGPHQANESIPAAENNILGTPDFLSPEQARDVHTVDIRSDLYSLGCTLYYLLTGKVPYPGGTTLEKLVRHNTETPTAIEKLRPDVSPPVAHIVKKLLAKDARARFSTPAELANALAPFSVQSAPPTTLPGYAASGVPTPSGASAWTATTPGHEDEEIALGTLPVNLTGTPFSLAGLNSAHLREAFGADKRMRLALIAAIAVVVLLIAGVAIFFIK